MRGSLAALIALTAPLAQAGDWPQWRGPARDGRLADAVARSEWPAALAPAWRVTVGEGHASPVVVGERVYVFTREGDEEVVRALELSSGTPVWRQSYPAPYEPNPAAHAHGKGPKATPVVGDGRICTFGIGGILSCLEAASGRLLWRREPGSRHARTSPLYGVATSPLLDRGRLIAHVGGPGDGALTALDAATGAVVWEWPGDGPAYASPVVAEIGGVRQVVTFTESLLVGVSAEGGELLWRMPFTTSYVQNAVTPIVHGNVVVYSGLDHPVRAVRIRKGPSGWTTEPLWENDEVAAYMSTPVLAGNRVFGLSHRRRGQLFALDATTGRTLWLSEGRQGDNAATVAGDEWLFSLTTEAELIVASRAADRFAPVRSYRVADSPTWAHPVVLDEGVLIKDRDALALLLFEGGTAGEAGSGEDARATVGAGLEEDAKGAEMSWIVFVVGAVLSWGLYGPVLHKGQVALGNPLRAFLFVGVAYFLVAVLVPLAGLAAQGQLRGFTAAGVWVSILAGTLGAIGAVCVIYAFGAGGTPLWVMPLVFAGAPIVNVLYSIWQHPPKTAPSPMLYAGFLLAAVGAYMVLHYKPQS